LVIMFVSENDNKSGWSAMPFSHSFDDYEYVMS
jgi:hypothetical protein